MAEWLRRLSPNEWLAAGMHELVEARARLARHAVRPGIACARRAAGMGWNAVLSLEESPTEAFGRTYVDHLRALAEGAVMNVADPHPIPEAVRDAARDLLVDPPNEPRANVVQIVTPRRDKQLAAAAETILAEAYVRVLRQTPTPES